MWERERSHRARSGEYGACRSVGISFSAKKKTGIPKSIRTSVCFNTQPNSYSTNLVYFFESLLVILPTTESRIVGLLSHFGCTCIFNNDDSSDVKYNQHCDFK